MALTQTYVYRGPFTLGFDNGAGGTDSFSGIRKDHVSFNLETKEDVEELSDGSEIPTEGGRRLVVEVMIDELRPADLDTIEGYVDGGASDLVTLVFGEMAGGQDTITLTACYVFASVEGLKAKFRIFKGYPVGTTIAGIITID